MLFYNYFINQVFSSYSSISSKITYFVAESILKVPPTFSSPALPFWSFQDLAASQATAAILSRYVLDIHQQSPINVKDGMIFSSDQDLTAFPPLPSRWSSTSSKKINHFFSYTHAFTCIIKLFPFSLLFFTTWFDWHLRVTSDTFLLDIFRDNL